MLGVGEPLLCLRNSHQSTQCLSHSCLSSFKDRVPAALSLRWWKWDNYFSAFREMICSLFELDKWNRKGPEESWDSAIWRSSCAVWRASVVLIEKRTEPPRSSTVYLSVPPATVPCGLCSLKAQVTVSADVSAATTWRCGWRPGMLVTCTGRPHTGNQPKCPQCRCWKTAVWNEPFVPENRYK